MSTTQPIAETNLDWMYAPPTLLPTCFRPGQFDLIRMNHVLEHLNDPVKVPRRDRQLACAGWAAVCRSAQH